MSDTESNKLQETSSSPMESRGHDSLEKRTPAVAGDGKTYNWLDYERLEKDCNGHVIDSIHARCADFVIYFCREGDTPQGASDLYYECTDKLLETMASANAALAKVNRMLPEEEKKRREILEFVADAFEMRLCGQKEESEKILSDIVTQLQVSKETRGRLWYQSATLVTALGVWALYFLLPAFADGANLTQVKPWILAAALGATGGFFSVCLNLGSIQVNANQSLLPLFFGGATRAAVALIAAIACLLAVQGKIILGLVGDVSNPETAGEIIRPAVMFFLFLAGFSETFIPNVLRDAEKNTPTSDGGKPRP